MGKYLPFFSMIYNEDIKQEKSNAKILFHKMYYVAALFGLVLGIGAALKSCQHAENSREIQDNSSYFSPSELEKTVQGNEVERK